MKTNRQEDWEFQKATCRNSDSFLATSFKGGILDEKFGLNLQPAVWVGVKIVQPGMLDKCVR